MIMVQSIMPSTDAPPRPPPPLRQLLLPHTAGITRSDIKSHYGSTLSNLETSDVKLYSDNTDQQHQSSTSRSKRRPVSPPPLVPIRTWSHRSRSRTRTAQLSKTKKTTENTKPAPAAVRSTDCEVTYRPSNNDAKVSSQIQAPVKRSNSRGRSVPKRKAPQPSENCDTCKTDSYYLKSVGSTSSQQKYAETFNETDEDLISNSVATVQSEVANDKAQNNTEVAVSKLHHVAFSTESDVIINEVIGDFYPQSEYSDFVNNNNKDNAEYLSDGDSTSEFEWPNPPEDSPSVDQCNAQLSESPLSQNNKTSAYTLKSDLILDLFLKSVVEEDCPISGGSIGNSDNLVNMDTISESETESGRSDEYFSDVGDSVSQCGTRTKAATDLPSVQLPNYDHDEKDETETNRRSRLFQQRAKSRGHDRRRSQAPLPPVDRKSIALKRDSKSYLYTVTPQDGDYPAGLDNTLSLKRLSKSSRSLSVDRLHIEAEKEKVNDSMPVKTKGGFFKTLLRKGKHSKSQSDLTQIDQPAPSSKPENVPPNEFLDTWVSSTAQHQIDETDPALKGVWPYDKKTEMKNYHGNSSTSKLDKAEISSNNESSVKPSVETKDWAAETDTSNFILKEKSKKGKVNAKSATLHNSPARALPALQTMTLQRPMKKPQPNEERVVRNAGVLSDVEGTISKAKMRDQYVPKFQSNRGNKAVSQHEAMALGATLVKKRNKTDTDLSQHWETTSNHSMGILKNGTNSNKTSPNGTLSKPVQPGLHGRQPSVPSSTYSGSSSGQSADYRIKEEESSLGKVSNPHDSGYESGTMRSRRNGGSVTEETATLRRGRRSPSLSSSNKTAQRATLTAIDSVPLCFDQLAAMNVSTLQQLCANFITNLKSGVTLPEGMKSENVKWHDIVLDSESEPVFTSNKCVVYKAHFRAQPENSFCVMLSLKKPATCPVAKLNILDTNLNFEANLPPHLVPVSMLSGKKAAPAHSKSVDEMVSTTKVPESLPKKELKATPSYSRQQSMPEPAKAPYIVTDEITIEEPPKTLRSKVSPKLQSAFDKFNEKPQTTLPIKVESSLKNPKEISTPKESPNSKSLMRPKSTPTFTSQLSITCVKSPPMSQQKRTAKLVTQYKINKEDEDKDIESADSLKSLQDEAVHSILEAVAGEDCDEDTENNNTSKARQRSSPVYLNSNSNNNIQNQNPGTPSNDFVLADHLLEMAGGEREEQRRDEPRAPQASSSPARGAVGLNRCDSTVTAGQRISCHVTVLPAHVRIESLKEYIARLNAQKKSESDLEMDIIYIVLQVLNIIFTLNENQLRLESISTGDFIVVTDAEDMSTLQCTMLNVTYEANQKLGLTCEKLRLLMMQIAHSTPALEKSTTFTIVDDMVQNAADLGDLRTIYTILQYLLWGPKDDEVKIITLAEHRRQAFELWLQLARGKLLTRLAFRQMDKQKIYMISNFLANTNGTELFKITKLLNTY